VEGGFRAMKNKSFKMIIIDGRRWSQRTYGNTYYSVSVTVDGVQLGNSRQQLWLYDDQYRQTAAEMLIKAGYFKSWDEFNDATRNKHDKFYFTVSDVKRERDL
jgi:hypothetical protein